MKALILSGGYAKRLQPMSLRTNKSMLPVAGSPNIGRIIEKIAEAGITHVVISMNVNQENMKKFLGDGSKFGVKIDYVVENSHGDKDKLGTVGALKYVIDNFGSDDFVVIGCDQYYEELALEDMINSHKNSGALVTIALYYLEDKAMIKNMGIAVINKNENIVSFQEKPKIEEAKSRLASTLTYVINKEFFDKYFDKYLSHKSKKCEKPDNIGELWTFFANKIKISSYKIKGKWWDIGNIKSFLQVNAYSMDKKNNGNKIGKNVSIGEGTRIINPVIIENDCKIGKNSIIGPYTHIMKGTTIGDSCSIMNSIIFEHVQINNEVKIENSTIDGKVKIGNNSAVHSYSNIGYKVSLGDGCRIFSGSKIWPFIKVGDRAVVEGDLKFSLNNTKFLKELHGSEYWNDK